MQWRQQATSGACEPHDHHCRSARSTCHFRGRQFFQRGDATRQSRQPADRPRWPRNAPMSAPDCTTVRDRRRPESACTIRTRRAAARHTENVGRLRRDGCNDGNEDDGDDGHSGDGGGDDGDHALPRSTPTHIAQPLQLRWYALTFILCGGRSLQCDQESRFERDKFFCPAARSTARNCVPARGL
jgi:hypothetical protein